MENINENLSQNSASIKENKEGIPFEIKLFIGIQIFHLIFGFLFRQIKSKHLRMLFSTTIGLVSQLLMYRWEMYHVFIAIFMNLLILKIYKRENCGKYAFIYNFAHNSLIHINRLIFSYSNWSFEISFIFMINVCKHISFAYSYQDYGKIQGLKIKSKDPKEFENEVFKVIHEENLPYAIQDFTSLEYVSFIFFFSTSLTGPYTEFKDFRNFISLDKEYKNIPSNSLLAINRFFNGVFLFLMLNLGSNYIKVEYLLDEKKEFSSFAKFLIFNLGGIYIFKYLAGFAFTEASCLSSGFSYGNELCKVMKDKRNNYDEEFNIVISEKYLEELKDKNIFNKGRCIDMIGLFCNYNPEIFFRYWNISIHHFLKRNVYNRNLVLTNKFDEEKTHENNSTPEDEKEAKEIFEKEKIKINLQKQKASSITFFVSAFWHGFYPSYFFAFSHFYLFNLLANQIRILSQLITLPNFLKDIIIIIFRYLYLFFLIPYHTYIFINLDVDKMIKAFFAMKGCVTFIAIFGNFLAYLFVRLLKKRKSRKNE